MNNINNVQKITERETNKRCSKLIEFIALSIFKDEDKADSSDTLDSTIEYNKYIRAMLKNDSITDYNISDISDIANKYKADLNTLSKTEITDKVLDLLRFKVYNEFLDEHRFKNKYYNDIFEKYIKSSYVRFETLNDFIIRKDDDFFVKAKISRDMGILYLPLDVYDSHTTETFINVYNSTLDYYESTAYNRAYEANNPKYKQFMRQMVIFMAMINFISATTSNTTNIDTYSSYELKNMLYSYGLNDYSTLPKLYQTRLLKSIHELITNKGTDNILYTILEIFGYDKVKLFKYLIGKSYVKDFVTNKIDYTKPKLTILKTDFRNNDINKILQDSEKIDIHEITDNDPLWELNKIEEEYVLKQDFNIIESKYLTIETAVSLMKNFINLSYYSNYILDSDYKIRNAEGVDYQSTLSFMNVNIAKNKPIHLTDCIMALEYLMLKKLGVKGQLIINPNQVATIYGYNFKFNPDIDEITYYINGKLKTINKKFIKPYYDRLKEVNPHLINNNIFSDLFSNNMDLADDINLNIKEAKSYEERLILSKIKDTLLISERRNKHLFNTVTGIPYTNHLDYFDDRLPEMGDYLRVDNALAEEVKQEMYLEKINEIITSMDLFVNTLDKDLFLNGIFVSTIGIKDYINQLIKLFKSYTIDLNQLTIFYLFDDPDLNKVFVGDGVEITNKLNGYGYVSTDEDTDFYLSGKPLRIDLNLRAKDVINIMLEHKNLDIKVIDNHSIEFKLANKNTKLTVSDSVNMRLLNTHFEHSFNDIIRVNEYIKMKKVVIDANGNEANTDSEIDNKTKESKSCIFKAYIKDCDGCDGSTCRFYDYKNKKDVMDKNVKNK